MMPKDFTILIAHPDDELLWAWPVLWFCKKIVCVSSDKNNPARQWCKDRKLSLFEVGERIGAEVICFDYDSEFYRLPTRNKNLKALAQLMINNLAGPVFTHNPWGEYGHLDHILCHQIAMASGLEVWSSDICYEINWLPMRQRQFGDVSAELDIEKFNELKALYDARGCWTWSFDIVKKCGISRLS